MTDVQSFCWPNGAGGVIVRDQSARSLKCDGAEEHATCAESSVSTRAKSKSRPLKQERLDPVTRKRFGILRQSPHLNSTAAKLEHGRARKRVRAPSSQTEMITADTCLFVPKGTIRDQKIQGLGLVN
jgi:hypothetical protein